MSEGDGLNSADELLVSRLQQGTGEAAEAIVEKYHREIFLYLRRLRGAQWRSGDTIPDYRLI